MIILDTDVISEPTKPAGSPRVLAWIDRQDVSSLWLTAVNLGELLSGVSVLPDGHRKEALRTSMEILLSRLIVTPILPFDHAAALEYAKVVAYAKQNRYTLPVADGQIAAIAKVHGYIVATRDVEPYQAAGVRVVNPWES